MMSSEVVGGWAEGHDLMCSGTEARRAGDLRSAESLYRLAFKLLGVQEHPLLAIKLAYVHRDRGDWQSAKNLVRGASADLWSAGRHREYARSLVDLGAIAIHEPALREAVDANRRAIELLEPSDLPYRVAALRNLAKALAWTSSKEEDRELEAILEELRSARLTALERASVDQSNAVHAFRLGIVSPALSEMLRLCSVVEECGTEIDSASYALDLCVLSSLSGRQCPLDARRLGTVFNVYGYAGLEAQARWISSDARAEFQRRAVAAIIARYASQVPLRRAATQPS